MLYGIYNANVKDCCKITAPIITVLVGIERYTRITIRDQNMCFELYSFWDRVSSMKSANDLEIYIQGQGMTSRLTKKPGSLGHPSTLNQRPKQLRDAAHGKQAVRVLAICPSYRRTTAHPHYGHMLLLLTT
jgi:hypothetical protein